MKRIIPPRKILGQLEVKERERIKEDGAAEEQRQTTGVRS